MSIIFASQLIAIFISTIERAQSNYQVTFIKDLPTNKACSFNRFYIRLINTNHLYFSNTCEDMELSSDSFDLIHAFSFKSTNAQGTLLPLIIQKESKALYMVTKESRQINAFSLNEPSEKYFTEFGIDLNGLYQLTEFTCVITTTDNINAQIAILQIDKKTQSFFIQKSITISNSKFAVAMPLLNGELFLLKSQSESTNLQGQFCDKDTLICNDPFSFSFALYYNNTYVLFVELGSNMLVICGLKKNRAVACFTGVHDSLSNKVSVFSGLKDIITNCSFGNQNYCSFLKVNPTTLIHSCGSEILKIQRFNVFLDPIGSLIEISGGVYHDYVVDINTNLIIVSSSLISVTDGHKYSVKTIAFPVCENVSIFITQLTEQNVFPFNKTVVFITPPSNLRIRDSSNCKMATQYLSTEIEFYTTDDIRSYLITYGIVESLSSINYTSNGCSLFINGCVFSCNACVKLGNNINHECTECKTKYYFIENTMNCINNNDQIALFPNYYLDTTDKKYKKCHQYCATCITLGDNTNTKCSTCITGFYKVQNDVDNCYSQCPSGYYLDSELNICKKCYNTCDTCQDTGDSANHQCLTCYRNFMPSSSISTNCVPTCKYNEYWYKDQDNNIYCLTTNVCPSDYAYLIKDTLQCVSSCPHRTLIYLNKCYTICPTGTKETYNIQTCTPAIDGIEPPTSNDITDSVNMDTDLSRENIMNQIDDIIDLSLQSTEDDITTVISGDDFKFAMYDSDASVSNGLKIPKVHIGNCETILRNHYHIPSQETLKIGQMSYDKPSSAIDKVQYSIYRENGDELDLSLCANTDISTSYPINTDIPGMDFEYAKQLSKGGLNIFDNKSDIFNDRCTVFSRDGKDLTLNDRRDKVFSNFSMCEDGCSLESIDFEAQYSNCTCTPQITGLQTIIERNPLINEFTSLISETNLPLFMCAKTLTLNGFFYNIGNMIMLAVLIVDIATYTVFIIVQLKQIYKAINQSCLSSPIKRNKSNNRSLKIDNHPKESDSINKSMKSIQEIQQQDDFNHTITHPKYYAVELNEMDYEDAREHDERNCFRYYIDICVQKHFILSTIFNGSLFYPITLRIILFIFSITMFFFFNAIFYTDEYISKRANMTGDLGFIYILENEFEKSIYASLICMVLGKLLSMVTSISLDYYRLMRNKHEDHFQFKLFLLINEMKKRMIIVGIAVFIFDIVFWYYLFIFCAIYQNNQVGWIESTFISLAINMFIPLVLCMIIAIMRYIGLSINST